MPFKPKKPCSYPGCPRLTSGRYCEKHQKLMNRQYEQYQRDPHTAERYGRNWSRIRNAFLSGHPFCELCRRDGRLTKAEIVHHIKPVREGGDNEEDNLMALCKPCHERLQAKRGDRWKKS